MKKVIIVESPTKARTISEILKNFEVYSSYGHIRDLPRTSLGVDVENNFDPKYIVVRKKIPYLNKIKQAIKNAEVYLATDYDREGEAIAWHLKEVLKIKSPKRIVFHEITAPAIKKAIVHPRKILQELVNAQQARRIIDRLFGYKLSPFLWRKIIRGLSAGRVQSACLRLIVEREQEIRKFKPKDYFRLLALFKEKGMEFPAYLYQIGKKVVDKFYFKKIGEVEKIKKQIAGRAFKISKIISRKKFISPPPPYITATLQQDAFLKLRFSAKKTMFLAQQLYEGIEIKGRNQGLITYMRTDSPSLSKEAQDKVRDFIAHKIGSDYLSKEPKVYKAHAKAQEAHEAIRPTNFNLSPDKVKPFLDQSQIKLYELIFWRTIASQMKEAEFRENLVYLDVEIKAKKYIFLAKGLKDVFLSFIKFYPYHLSLNLLPELTEGVFIRPEKIEILSLKTKPKPRYTEASLIKTLEKLGIGRPSTYAPIIDILFQRNYLQRQGRYLFPTEIGEKVIEFLKAHFNHLIDYGFTADMEEKLDQIAEGKRKWVNIVSDFYTPLAKLIAKKDSEIDRTKVIEKEYIDKKCPKCQGRLAIRFGRFGKFISCDNFPKCSYKEALSKNNNIEAELDSKTKEALARVREKFPFCPKCKGQLVLRKSKFGFFLGCKNYPRCRFIAPLSTKPEFKNKKY